MSQTENTVCNCGCGSGRTNLNASIRGRLSLVVDCGEEGSIEGGCCVDYSFEEQWTGRRWVNGKKIYQKTINFGPLPAGGAGGATKYVDHNIPNIDTITSFDAVCCDSNNTVMAIPHVNHNPNAQTPLSIQGAVTPANVRVQTWNPNVGDYKETYFTLFYTCTDR